MTSHEKRLKSRKLTLMRKMKLKFGLNRNSVSAVADSRGATAEFDSFPLHCLLKENEAPPNPSLCCVLIHGTWARDALWAQPDSALASELRTFLGTDQVALYRYLWSHKNSHIMRVRAARELARALQAEARMYPNARFLLIGHSHGGAIAMNAAAGVPTSQRVGVVCLATPFIHSSEQTVLTDRIALGALGAFITLSFYWAVLSGIWHLFHGLATTAFAAPWRWFYKTIPWMAEGASLMAGFGIAILGLLVTCCAVIGSIALLLHVSPHRAAAMKRWSGLRPEKVAALCIWYGLDEAYWPLHLFRYFRRVIGILVSSAILLVSFLSLAAALWHLVVATLEAFFAPDVMLAKLDGAITFVRGLTYVSAAVLFVSVWFSLLHRFLSLLALLLVGAPRFLDAYWLDFRIGREPQLEGSLVQRCVLRLDARLLLKKALTFFPFANAVLHSHVYSNSMTAVEIKRWYLLQQGAGEPPCGSPQAPGAVSSSCE